MINPACLIGDPILFSRGISIYPPKVRDVISNPNYNLYLTILCTSQDEIEDMLTENAAMRGAEIQGKIPTPLEFLLANCYASNELYLKTREAFSFFLHEQVAFSFESKSVIIGDVASKLLQTNTIPEIITLNEDNFFAFQNSLRGVCGLPEAQPYKPSEDPRIRRIKAKARYRDKVKAKSKKGLQLGESLAAICCMGLGITPLNIGELSYASVSILMDTYQHKEKYEMDIKSLLAGADSKKIKPKYWIGETN